MRTGIRCLAVALLFMLLGPVGTAVAAAAPRGGTQAERPNVVVIFADDLGYGDLGCYGSKTIATPRLDRMAAEGVRFTDFYVTAPICSPSRMSLLTGRYPQRAGMPFVLFPAEPIGISDEEVTLAELLKKQGYATACVGKWHVGNFLNHPQFAPRRHGFDEYFGLPYSNDSLKRPPGEKGKPWLGEVDLPLIRGEKIIEAPVRQETLTQRYTDEAVRFIRANKDRPFFLYLPHTFPHTPLFASKEFAGKSKGGLYGDTVECLDGSVGRILDTLRELGLDERTLVVFTSDNGPAPSRGAQRRGSAGPLKRGKFTTYEGGLRVPAIVRWPGRIPKGRTCRELATIMDLLPTLTKLAGGEAPTDRIIDGKDIAPLLLGEAGASSPHEAFFYHIDYQLQAVRCGTWKLFLAQDKYPKLATIMYDAWPKGIQNHFPLRPKPVLYDLAADLGETTDVAAQHGDVVKRLTDIARRFQQEMDRTKRPIHRAR